MFTWLMVGLGGAVGACSRFAIGLWFKPQPGQIPYATLTANVSGCFVMGVLYVLIVDRQTLPADLRAPLIVGFLGALTTFSSFAVEALGLWQTEQTNLALIYVLSSVVLCLLAVWLGYNLTEWLAGSFSPR